jgi:hypothetical protein
MAVHAHRKRPAKLIGFAHQFGGRGEPRALGIAHLNAQFATRALRRCAEHAQKESQR